MSRNEADLNLTRLEHPQAASMQHALEKLFSRDSHRSSRVSQTTRSDRCQARELVPAVSQWGEEPNALSSRQCAASPTTLRVTTSLHGTTCGKFCQCQCHIHTQVCMPRWLSGCLGIMFGTYRGTPTLKARPCNYRKCKRSTKTNSHFTYYFPSRLLNAALTFTSTWQDVTGTGGSWHISIPPIISDQHVVWGSHTWTDGDILNLFCTGRASPYMVRESDGYSVLFVSSSKPDSMSRAPPSTDSIVTQWAIHHWKLEICKYLLGQNADKYIPNKKGRLVPTVFS